MWGFPYTPFPLFVIFEGNLHFRIFPLELKRHRITPMAQFDLSVIQSALTAANLDGWLFYDHHYRDPLAYSILGLPQGQLVTRRWYYFIPATGTPKKLVHRIEAGRLDTLPGPKSEYSSWQELEAGIESLLTGQTKIAMQYSPRNAIMYVALVDAGTIELLRSLGKEIVTSANLISQFEAVLTDAQIATHLTAGEKVDRVLAAGFEHIGNLTRNGATTHEQAIVDFLQEGMTREGLVWEHGTNVSCGSHSADSHYHPSPETSAPIRTGDFILIDIWARLDQPSPPPATTTSPGPASSAVNPPNASNTSSPPSATPETPHASASSPLSPPTSKSPATRPTMPPAPSSAPPASPTTSPTAPATTSATPCTAAAPTSTISKPMMSGGYCQTPASPSNPASTSPASSASAARST